MSKHDRFSDGAFSAICGGLHFSATQATSFANRMEANRHGVTLFPTDERAILEAAERLEHAARAMRETVVSMKRPTLMLVAAE